MTKIHYLAASGATSVALMFGVALPASAQTVNGNCSSIMQQNVYQTQTAVTTQTNVTGPQTGTNVGGLQALTSQTQTNTNSADPNQSNSSSNTQTASQNFSADCSTHVTNVTQTTASSQQVSAPKGGVSAGEGMQVSSATSAFGLAGSLVATSAGLGLRFLKREL